MGPTVLLPSKGSRGTDFYRPQKSIDFCRVWTREPWVQWQAWLPLDHGGRYHIYMHLGSIFWLRFRSFSTE
jgi:hypothetical protein